MQSYANEIVGCLTKLPVYHMEMCNDQCDNEYAEGLCYYALLNDARSDVFRKSILSSFPSIVCDPASDRMKRTTRKYELVGGPTRRKE
jgi:hypothetical protein